MLGEKRYYRNPDDASWDQGRRSSSDQWSDSKYILKMGPTRFSDGFDVMCERKRRIRNDQNFWLKHEEGWRSHELRQRTMKVGQVWGQCRSPVLKLDVHHTAQLQFQGKVPVLF